MNPQQIFNRKVIAIPAITLAGVITGGGLAVAVADDLPGADDLTGTALTQASAVALAAVGGQGARVTKAEHSTPDADDLDEVGEAYEVEVTRADGVEIDISLDRDFAVIGQEQAN